MSKGKYTSLHRILHWVLAFALLFMLLTIFLRENWMSKYNMSDILTEQLSERNVELEEGETITIAKKIRKPMWNWHVWVGYGLMGVYLLRMLVFFIQGATFKSPFSKDATGKEKFESWMYSLFYICLAYSLVTGGMIVWGSHDIHELGEELHEPSVYWLVIYMSVHLIGVVAAELGRQKGIISKMISGE